MNNLEHLWRSSRRFYPGVCVSLYLAFVGSAFAAEVRIERNVSYAEAAPKPRLADIYRPHGSGPFPAILVIHGGAWMSGDKLNVAAKSYRLAKSGYVAVAINYRLAPQFPHPAQIDDCRAGLTWMLQQADDYQIDRSRIGVMGYSAGGHLACLLGFSEWTVTPVGGDPSGTHPVKAIVAGGTPSDFREIPPRSEHLAYWLGGTNQQRPTIYREASPIVFASEGDPPTFLYHGDQDRLVKHEESQRLARRLTEQGVRTEFYTVTGAGHLRAFFDPTATDRAVAFLDEQLRNRSQMAGD